MSSSSSTELIIFICVLLIGSSTGAGPGFPLECGPKNNEVSIIDIELIQVALNLEFLEADYFSWGSMGVGLDYFEPELAMGGPPPIGVQKANLSPLIRDIMEQFAFQEFGHIRAIEETIKGFPRPLMNLSKEAFATVMNSAFEKPLEPPFNAYANDINYILSAYVIPYVGLTGYVGANPNLICPKAKKLVAGLLGVEAGQDAVIRTLLYKRKEEKVYPYNYTIAEFTDKISILRNNLGNKEGIKDEGLVVPPELGPEGKTSGNILAGDCNSLSYPRTPEEIFRIVYGTGNETKPDLFYPKGANGIIARSYLHRRY